MRSLCCGTAGFPQRRKQGKKSVAQKHEIRLAWESFLLKGKAPQGISQTIASSWKRSRTLGVAVERGEAPLAGEPEVFRRRSQNAVLLTAARPALQRSSLFLAEASSMMILSDPSGFIIETAGDPRIVDQGRRNHLEIGGNWEEGAIGTNAIGTARKGEPSVSSGPSISARMSGVGPARQRRCAIRGTGSCSGWSTSPDRRGPLILRASRWP
jgi:hypothetical protein